MDIINLLLSITLLTHLMLVSISITSGANNEKNSLVYKAYIFNILTIVSWIGLMILYRSSLDNIDLLINAKLLYISASFIASSFYVFSLYFTKSNIKHKNLYVLFAINTLLALSILFSDYIIKGVHVSNSGRENQIQFGNFYIIYVLFILILFSTSFYKLYNSKKSASSPVNKAHLFYVFIGYVISGLISFTSNLILPWFNIFTLNWLGQISTLFMTFSVTYSFAKYKLFNCKYMLIELSTFILWVLTIIKFSNYKGIDIFLESNLSDTLYLIMTIAVGILLLKSVKSEAEQKEQNEKLAAELNQAKLKLEELDEIKTSFVSLATHNMSTPITTIKGYVSMLREDGYEFLDQKVLKEKYGLRRIDYVMDNLVTIIRDFLDISRLETNNRLDNGLNSNSDSGSQIESVNIFEIFNEVINDLRFYIDQNNLKISFGHTKNTQNLENFQVLKTNKSDLYKAFFNILENSIKHSKDSTIYVNIMTHSNSYEIEIVDDGQRSIPKISQKLANKLSVKGEQLEAGLIGKGLGIYVARQLLERQRGNLFVEYLPENLQWKFKVSLPA